jgi:hypothetical protein
MDLREKTQDILEFISKINFGEKDISFLKEEIIDRIRMKDKQK